MVTWDNLDTLASFQNLSKTGRIDLKKVMSGENGAERVKNYSIPMAEGLVYNYAAKQVDDDVLANLRSFTTVQSSTPERIVWFFIS